MLTADKNLWLEKIFAVYNRNLFRRRFNSLQMSGLHFLENKPENAPLVIYANHSSWWDGLTAFQISRRAALDSFIMMEEKQLKILRFFRKLGAFSVVRENKREALKSINYAIQTLQKNPKRTLWVFPQGEISPNDVRPLRFYNGLAKIIKNFEKCSIICLAMRYEFLGEYKPDIFVKIKKIDLSAMELKLKPQEISGILSDHLTGCLNELKAEIVSQNFSDFEQIC